MYREFPYARKDTRECLQYALDVVRGIHIRRIKSRYHRVEPRLLLFVKRPVGHRYVRVGKGIVIKRRVGIEIVCRCTISIYAPRPLLLKRNTEQSHAADLRAHYFEEVVDICTFLYVIG